jgi:hypothetical protein
MFKTMSKAFIPEKGLPAVSGVSRSGRRRRYAVPAAPLLLGATLFVTASVAHALPRSHCKLNEEVLFTCNMRLKTLSVCSSKEVTGSPRTWIQYRFGVIGSPELVYPPDLRSPVGIFKHSLETGGRWRDVRIQFSSNGFRYVLHAYGNSAIVESEASLTVVTPEGVKKELRCADPGTYAAAGLWPFEEFKLPPVDEDLSR